MLNLETVVKLIFWLPVASTILFNLLWDIQLFQAGDYSLFRTAHALRWDFRFSHRAWWHTVIKLCAFIATLSFIWFPASLVPLVGILVAFGMWVNDNFEIIRRLAVGKLPAIRLDLGSFGILISAILLLGLLPSFFALLTKPVTAVQTLGSPAELLSILPTTSPEGFLTIPAIYLFLVFATLTGILVDIASPLLGILLLVITFPVRQLQAILLINKARIKFSMFSDLKVIVITGSSGKTELKNLLLHLLKGRAKVSYSPGNVTSLTDLAKDINQHLSPQSDIYIVEALALRPGRLAAIANFLRPQIVIVHSIDEGRLGLFKNSQELLVAQAEILHFGTSVLNGDDAFVRKLIELNTGKEVVYTTQEKKIEHLLASEITTTAISASEIQAEGKSLQFLLNTHWGQQEIQLADSKRSLLPIYLGAASTALLLGLNMEQIAYKLKTAHIDATRWQVLPGDNDTQLFIDPRRPSFKSIKHNMEALPHHRTILITEGVKELGKHKQQLYADLATAIQSKVSILITPDKHLIKMIKLNNTQTQLILTRNIDQAIYSVRTNASPGDNILILGNIPAEIVTRLVAGN